jgi:tRNA pseudouridine55 synthase
MSLNGLLNVNKPSAWTSRDAVNRVARLCRPAKAGHAGTLDPLATGVLVICVGQATRLIEYVQRMRKCYRATFQLGRTSETDDTEGAVSILANAPTPNRTDIDCVLPRFVGSIWQRPSTYSAIKVQGRRAYELARRGVAVPLVPRKVDIHRLDVVRYDYPHLEIDIECGSGTYVRALGRDLAAELGTAAVMSALQRIAIGRFHIDDSVPLKELTPEAFAENLQPPLAAIADLPRVMLDDAQLNEIRFGRSIAIPAGASHDSLTGAGPEWAGISAGGQLAAILREKHAGRLWPRRNFLSAAD